jgi:type I restriction enzyme R subunit
MLVLRTQLAILQAIARLCQPQRKDSGYRQCKLEEQSPPFQPSRPRWCSFRPIASDEWWEDVTVPMLETVPGASCACLGEVHPQR